MKKLSILTIVVLISVFLFSCKTQRLADENKQTCYERTIEKYGKEEGFKITSQKSEPIYKNAKLAMGKYRGIAKTISTITFETNENEDKKLFCSCLLDKKGEILVTMDEMIESNMALTNNFTSLRYDYSDASVDPEFNRSYYIEIANTGNSKYGIRSYDDILFTQEFKITAEDLTKINSLIGNLKGVSSLKRSKETGGSAEGLTITKNEILTIDEFWDSKTPKSVQLLIDKIKETVTTHHKILGKVPVE